MIKVIGGSLLSHGRQGDQYVIPVKGMDGKRMPLPMVQYFCRVFLAHALACPDDQFQVTVIGGGKPSQVAPFFDYCPPNIYLPYEYQY